MKNILLLISFITITSLSYSQNNFANNQLIIQFKSKPTINFKKKLFNNKIDKINKAYKLQEIRYTGNKKNQQTFLFLFKNPIPVLKLVQEYLNTNLFTYVEPNFIGYSAGHKGETTTFPNENLFNRQWYLYNDGTFNLLPSIADADIDMELAWDIEQGSNSIIVAVLDSGTKLNHPEFYNRIWTNPNETSNNTDSDSNGYTDDVNGWDFANNDNNPTDDQGHGTNVMGIIGANANNGIGYAGIDWNCKLMPFKILNSSGSGYYSWWAEAIYYAVNNGAKVINMSVGGASFSNTLQDAVNYAYNNNVTIIACMMNFNDQITYYPAGFQNTIAVGATNSNDERTAPFFWDVNSGSNFGNHIDVVAPGNYIYGLNHLSNTNYNTYWGGTSQATPQVTGLCSLLLSQDPTRTVDEIRTILHNTAEDQVGNLIEDTTGFDIYYGYGRINAFNALNQINLSIPTNELDLLKIYPNPVAHDLYVEGSFKSIKLEITNFLGQQIYSDTFKNTSKIQIDISNFKTGVYFLKILDVQKNTSKNTKIYIKR